ncbi:MAG: DUF4412 domain-containing protein [Chthoniobacterales bacterium]
MKAIPLFAVAFTLVTSAFGGVEIIQTVENAARPEMDMTLKVQVEGNQARVDIGDTMSTITGRDDGSLTTLMHGQKMAMTIPSSAIDAMKSRMKDLANDSAEIDIKPTGRKEEINGFSCEEYTGTVRGMKSTYWITNDVPNQAEIVKQLSKLAGDSDPFKGVFVSEEFPGFPIRTEVTSEQAGASVLTVQSVTEKDVPAGAFEVPEDYKSTAMPTLPGGIGN